MNRWRQKQAADDSTYSVQVRCSVCGTTATVPDPERWRAQHERGEFHRVNVATAALRTELEATAAADGISDADRARKIVTLWAAADRDVRAYFDWSTFLTTALIYSNLALAERNRS